MRFVVILATGFFFYDCNFNWLQFVTDSFFYLCANKTRHASDLSALCRVVSASRKVCGYPCGWLSYLESF